MGGLHAINLTTAWCPPREAAGPWVRRFGRPAGIEPGDSVWLVVVSPSGCGLRLNGSVLPSVDAGGVLRHEVTNLLLPRNELELAPVVVGTTAVAPVEQERCPLPATIAGTRLEIEAGPPRGHRSP